jgi:uncharacterized coiled-coil protein SlyX
MNALEARLVDLELRFMKLERDTQDLSDVVAEQQKTIDALRLEARRLREKLSHEEEPSAEEKPPHY